MADYKVPPEFETDRLFFRQWTEDDLAPLARLNADKEMVRYLGRGAVMSRADNWRQIALLLGHWQMRGYGLWAVEEKASAAFIGRIGLWYPEGWPGVEAGWLVDRAHWGKGYASEGGRAALEIGFERLGVSSICSVIHPENAASIRVAEKIGERFSRREEVMGVPAAIYEARRDV